MGQNLRIVDRQTIFNQLVTKYEPFLKKLYYLIHQEELPAQRNGSEATLANAIHEFDCLWSLQDDPSPDYRLFGDYLQKVRDWRNLESHNAPVSTEQELSAATKVVTAMYLFVTGSSISDLEEAGYY